MRRSITASTVARVQEARINSAKLRTQISKYYEKPVTLEDRKFIERMRNAVMIK